jgi:hypothetical protein
MSEPWWGVPLLAAGTTIAGGVVTFAGSWLAESRRLKHEDKLGERRFDQERQSKRDELLEERWRQGRDAALAFISSLNVYRGVLISDLAAAPARMVDIEEKLAAVQGSCSGSLAFLGLKAYGACTEIVRESRNKPINPSKFGPLGQTLAIAQQKFVNQYRSEVGLNSAGEFDLENLEAQGSS